MKVIATLIKKYKLNQKTFAELYFQVVWKEYHEDVSQLSDRYYQKIESLIKAQKDNQVTKKSGTIQEKKKNTDKKWLHISKNHKTENSKESKAIKTTWSLDLQDDFLAWLGFETPSISKQPDTKNSWSLAKKWHKKSTQDDSWADVQGSDKNEKDTTILNPFTSWFGNATVIRSDPSQNRNTVHHPNRNDKHSWSQKSHPKYTTPKMKPKGNIEFFSSNYKTKENTNKEYKRINTTTVDQSSNQWWWSKVQISTHRSPKSSTDKITPQSRFTHKGIKIDYTKSGTTKISNNIHIHTDQKNRQISTQKVATPKIVKEAKSSDTLVKKNEVIISNSITVKEFSEKIWIPVSDIIKKMLANKILWWVNTSLDFDTASLIAGEFDVVCNKQTDSIAVQDIVWGNIQKLIESDKDSIHAITRPPIITVMGHVDHGKTKLLDYIRKTNILSEEAWGITQSIGASQIIHNGQKITFIDTPGHALFTSLRSRGAKLTDICIIVVAADDGIKPQTVEAIAHAKDSGVPIIIAITKIDKWIDNTDMIKSQMAEYELIPEDWWWNVPIVKVSAVTWQGIDDLLDQILFQVEILDLKYDPTKAWLGVILEATKDAKQWVLANVIVMSGTLHIGDIFVVHNIIGKVKKMIDSHGKSVKSATGGDPIKIYGISQVPEPGRILEVVENEKHAHQRAEQIMATISKESNNLQSLLSRIAQGDQVQLKLILKADGFWSLEALKYSMNSVQLPENIHIKIVYSDVGNFSDSDLELAKASESILIWFNLDLHSNLKKKTEQMKLTMRSFHIIYEIIDYVEQLAQGLVKHEAKEVYIGKLDILAIFFRKWGEMIVWGKIIDGEIRNGSFFRIRRSQEESWSGRITSLQKWQESVSRIGVGYECGIKVRVDKKIEAGDQLECFVME